MPPDNQDPEIPTQSGLAFTSLPLGQKAPRAKGWNKRENAITSPEDIKQLTSCNVGLLHAFCTPATCSLDVDDLEKAKQALSQEAGIDIVELLSEPKFARISSGRPNSAKIIFKLPEEHQSLITKVIRDNDEKVIFELRCADSVGNSVCDVVPPSIHPRGTRYVWANGVGLDAITEIPAPLLEYWLYLIDKDTLTKNSLDEKNSVYQREETPRRVALLRQMLDFISADCSRDKWLRIVFSILSTQYSVAETIAYEWSITSDKYTEEDFRNLIKYYNSEAVGVNGAISLGTIYFHAREGGWHG